MASTGKSANITFRLAGVEVLPPEEFFDIGFIAEFGQDGVQPSLSLEELTFANEAVTVFEQAIESGLNGGSGIFEALPFDIVATSENESIELNYAVVLSKIVRIPSANRVTVPIRLVDGLDSLQERLDSITFGTLEDEGFITSSDYDDIDYVVEKPFNILENLVTSIILYQLLKEAASLIQRQGDTTATSAGITSGSPSGGIGATVFSIIKTAIDIAYALTLAALLIRLSQQLGRAFLPPRRTSKMLNMRVAMEKIAEKLEYEFESDLTDLEKVYYLPSNQNYDTKGLDGFIDRVRGTDKGIPNPKDYGYGLGEFVQLVKSLFLANVTILDGKLYLNWKGSDFFESQADVILFDSLDKNQRYNDEDAVRSRLIAFSTDQLDEHTIDNFKGTNYEVLTSPIKVTDEKLVTLEGAERIDIPVALGTRKNSLNPFEEALESLFNVVDGVVNVLGSAFGLSSNFSSIIGSRVGLLKVSNNNYSIPKVLWVENGRLPSNHRDELSAKALYDKYYFWKSFVANADKAQKKVYDNVEVPFGIIEFAKVLRNAYFYDSEGARGKITALEWRVLRDRATVSYFIRDRYTDNIQERFIEA